MRSFDVQDMFNLVINLLGFRLLNKNVAIVWLEKRERNLAYFEFFVLNQKKRKLPVQTDQKGTIIARDQVRISSLTSFR